MVFRDRVKYLAEGLSVRGADVQAPRVGGETATGRMHARNASSVTVAELRHSQSALDQRPFLPADLEALLRTLSFLEALTLSSFSQQRFPPSPSLLNSFRSSYLLTSASTSLHTFSLCRCRLSFSPLSTAIVRATNLLYATRAIFPLLSAASG